MALLALTTAVAMYERMDRQAATAAVFLLVVLSSTLYAPPLSGSAVTASPYTEQKRRSVAATSSMQIGANTPPDATASPVT